MKFDYCEHEFGLRKLIRAQNNKESANFKSKTVTIVGKRQHYASYCAVLLPHM